MRRICSTIKTSLTGRSFPLFSLPLFLIKNGCEKGKIDAGYSKGAVTLCIVSCSLSRSALRDKLRETLHKRSHLATGSSDLSRERKVA